MPNDNPAAPDPNAQPAPAPVVDPAPQPVPAPAADPAPAPVVAPEPAPVTAPVVAPAAAPVADAPKPDAAPVEPVKPEASLLETLGPDGKPKVADAKPVEPAEPPKPDAQPVPEPVAAEPIKYEAFTLPEGVTITDQPAFDEATAILAQHRIPQDVAQDLVTRHAEAMRKFAAHTSAEQHRVFGETREAWRTEIKADPILGGAGHQTAMALVAQARDRFVTPEEMPAFNDFLRTTGAGDNIWFHRVMHRVGKLLSEPGPGPVPQNPPPDRGGKAPGGRRARVYDHPTSNQNRVNGAGR